MRFLPHPIPRTNQKSSVQLMTLMALALGGLIIVSVILYVISLFTQEPLDANGSTLHAAITAQDIIIFIFPAIAAMAIFYRRPLHLMCLDRAPKVSALLMVVLVWAFSLPAMNYVVKWNAELHLPDSLSGLEQILRSMEDSAEAATAKLLGGTSVSALIISLATVALLAGVSEECFFRGGLQTMLTARRINTHAAVWMTAIIFSAIHMEFFGFVPRMFLGAWLGYLLVRTGSLWVPILAHALNNGTVVIVEWMSNVGYLKAKAIDNIGTESTGFPWLAAVSAVATLAIVVLWLRPLERHAHADSGSFTH